MSSLPPTQPLPDHDDAGPLRPVRHDPDSRDLLPGAWLGDRYEILARIGRGGAGWVYAARDHREGVRVALKVLSSQGGAATERQVAREVRVTREIDHPNVVRALGLRKVDERSVMVMELVDGEPVARLLRRSGPLPVARALAIIRDVASGLEAAHRRGVVHRDLKPGNVILDQDGRARIADFGLAIAAAAEPGGRQAPAGTPEYMAPEQVEGRACDRRADVFALGVMLFEMLTGEVPFRGSGPLDTALERLRRDAPDPCQRNAMLPRWLGDLVLRCLAREPAARLDSMSDVLHALDLGEAGEAERPTRPLDAVHAAVRRRRVRRAIGVAVAAMLLVMAGAWLAPRRPAPGAPLPPLFADGVARVAVAEATTATEDPASRVTAAGVTEALRARLARLDRVTVIDVPGEGAVPDSVELLWTLRVIRLGEEVRLVATVTRYPGAERWMTVERSDAWEGSWERIDEIADDLAGRAVERLAKES